LEPELLGTIGAGTVVVVDDLDHPLPPALAQTLVDLCSAGRHLRVLVSGRGVEGLRRVAWRRGVQVSSLDAADLAATPAELVEMARSWGHDLSAERAAAVHAATGGWPGVARLLLDAADTDSETLDLDAAVGYLDATVLETLAPPTRQA